MSDAIDDTWNGKLCAHEHLVAACVECRANRLEAALDDLWMQAVEGPSPGWVMIPHTEWRQIYDRVRPDFVLMAESN